MASCACAAAAAPASGHYDATLCVDVSGNAAQAPNCGPADVDIQPDGGVRVQVSDIVYRLQVKAGKAAVVVITQGTMQLDEFVSGTAEWTRTSLRFVDEDKQVRYEVRVGSPKRVAK